MRVDDLPISIECPPGAPLDLTCLPDSRGVAVFESADGRPIQILASSRLRGAVARRLDPSANPAAPSRHADLRAITCRVRAASASCPFECDLIFLRLAHAAMPGTFRAVMDRRRAWFLHVDADATHPRFTVVPTSAMPGSLPSGGHLLGPVADKHAAQRLQQTLEDLFDLCRFHHILVRSPHADACAYKELGKCPAPCDGSESLDAYRARVRDAIDLTRSFPSRLARLDSDMATASRDMRFERAAALKHRIDAMRALMHHKTRHALTDPRPGWAVLAPGPEPEQPRAFVVGMLGVRPARPAPESIEAVARGLAADRPDTELHAAIMGLVGDALHRPPRKAQRLIALGSTDWPEQLAQARRALSRTSDDADDDSEDHEAHFIAEPTPP